MGPITELRKRLGKAGAEIHVVKNSIFRLAAKEAGVAELNGSLAGQVAVVTGQKDISAAAKVVKNFNAEFEKLKIRFGYLNNNRLEASDLIALADLPSIEVLRGKLLGVLQAPATKLVVLLNTPASQLARVSAGARGQRRSNEFGPSDGGLKRFHSRSSQRGVNNNKQQSKSSACRQ